MSSTDTPAISISHLVKKFGAVEAVKDISLTVKPGEIFAFLGPNGAGKSTTIKMLTTLLRPTSGEIRLAGHDVLKEQDATRRSFGIVFQDPSLDGELSATDNMLLHAALYRIPKPEAVPRIRRLLEMLELWERRDSLVKTFSGGMKRRLEIARGLLHRPQILFLDEPTLGLDTQTRSLLWSYVRQLSHDEQTTVFFTTHYLEEAEAVAQRIAIIDHGQLVALGTAKQLRQQTATQTLEQAYLALTGSAVRDDYENPTADWARTRNRMRNH